jgi:hypothetical protein
MKNIVLILLFFVSLNLHSQVEHVHVYHPVYDFLIRAEAKDLLPYFSTTQLPLQRKEIVVALKTLKKKKELLSKNEVETLESFLVEFGVSKKKTAVMFKSKTDDKQLFFKNIVSDKEKYVYNYYDSLNSVRIEPIGSVESFLMKDNFNETAQIAQGGARIYGTVEGKLGYFLQATNGTLIRGSQDLLLEDRRLAQNIKLTELNSDFDFTESHLRADFGNVYFYVGRESRLLGSGINQRMFNSDVAPPFDAISAGYRVKNFEYRFTHGSLLSSPFDSTRGVGFHSEFPNKYFSQHRFALRFKKGEIAAYEAVIYSRDIDLAYLNPLRFLKTLEHALRDRDNSLMGADFTYRPIKNIELKGSYLLDDIVISEIGNNFWSNKAAYNLGVWFTPNIDADFGLEYARVEPYTFSHFNYQNAVLHDELLLMGYMQPNSEKYTLATRYWWGSRYPLKVNFEYLRHGRNIYDNDTLFYNVGGDAGQTRRHPVDNDRVRFLDGDKHYVFATDVEYAFELTRNLNLVLYYRLNYNTIDKSTNHFARIKLRFWEF